jgi:8-amino-7-oxononanoate synthase
MERDYIYRHYREALEEIESNGSLRFLKTVGNREGKHVEYLGRSFINLSSNDYLGLGTERALIEEFYSGLSEESYIVERFGPGSTSSRLLTGDFPGYRELEEEIASAYSRIGTADNRREALVFSSGYHANVGIISALTGKGDLILSDSLNHASIIDGVRLSKADYSTYNHMDYHHLKELLGKKRDKYKNVLIVSESVFSMDGDIADLTLLCEIKKEFGAMLYIDEAHALGVFGERGLGICERESAPDIDILIATFGKALGSMGAFAVLHKTLKEYLVNRMRTLIFTTALPPVIVNWNLQVMKRLGEYTRRREKLIKTASFLREKLKSRGLETRGESQIIPVITGSNERTMAASEKLQERGYLLFPIRPPSVPEGSSRLRISLTSNIDRKDIEDIPGIISETGNKNG